MMAGEDAGFRRRLVFFTAGILIWSLVIVGRLVFLQLIQGEHWVRRSALNHEYHEKIPAKSGEILDCHGKVLALTQEQPSICADPSVVDAPQEVAESIGRILGKKKSWINTRTKRLENRSRSFAYLARWVTPKQAAEIQALKHRGVFVQEEPVRIYPKEWIASHVIGFTSLDGSVQEGAEAAFHSYLAGTPGEIQTYRDGRQMGIWLGPQMVKEPVNGRNVTLTLDENIQFFTEEALRRGLLNTRAANLSAIVMDPQTGAIKAMANMPDFNPNIYYRFSSQERKNRAIVDCYEPASAFKIVTVAAALDLGTIDLDRRLFCEEGGIHVQDKFIHDHKPFGTLSVREILWYSSNVGAIKVAQTMPEDAFYRYIRKFGFGRRTGIDLPAEAEGIFHPLEDWSLVSSAFLAIGHEISVTPLQMLVAASVIANGGLLVHPHLGKTVVDADGRERDIRPQEPPRRVIRPEVATAIARALEGVVLDGTGKNAAVPGIRVFGKTGTAQRIQGRSYSKEKYNASFVGFFPLESPRYGIIVVVHDPKQGGVHGGEVAAPIFSEIARQIALYESDLPGLGRRRLPMMKDHRPAWSSPRVVERQQPGTTPDFSGLGLRSAILKGARLGVTLEIEGDGVVMHQSPQPGTPLEVGEVCRIILGEG